MRTSIAHNNGETKDKTAMIYFEVLQMGDDDILKMDRQFKADGYKV